MLLSKLGERWQYAILPLEPEWAATAGAAFNMGTTGWINSGGVLFDHRSNTDGSLAAYYEIDSLDPCWGHSNQEHQYHYHLTPECIDGAADNSTCLHLGYMDDGFPVYGQCGTYREGGSVDFCTGKAIILRVLRLERLFWQFLHKIRLSWLKCKIPFVRIKAPAGS